MTNKLQLVLTSCSLFVMSLQTGLLLQSPEAIWLYTLQYHIITCDKFCWSLGSIFSASCVYPDILCIIRCLQSESAVQ